MKRCLLIVTALICWAAFECSATHIKGGQIIYSRNNLNVSISLIVYSNRSAVDAGVDDPTATINWGDGTSTEYTRASKRLINDNTYENVYLGEHTYPGTGTYIICYSESNRTGGVKNMTNSINTPFYIESMVGVVSGYTVKLSSPSFLSPPIFHAEKNRTFTNNLSVYSPDKDSVSYKLVTCKQARGNDVEGYFIPEGVKINPYSGQITWDKPSIEGLYNFAALVEFWKNGIRVGFVIRDFQVAVSAERISGQVFEVTASHDITPGNSVPLNLNDVFTMEVLFQDTTNSLANLDYIGELQNEEGVFNIAIEEVPSNARNSSINKRSPVYKASVSMTVQEKHKRTTPYNLIFRGETKNGWSNISNDLTIQLYIGVQVPLSVSSNGVKGNLNLSFYPVPVNDQLTIKKESNDSGTLIIYNSVGRDVKSIYLGKGVVDTHLGIDLKSGTYIYNFNSDNSKEFTTGKFIVN
ncbi:hypothetical protein MYP_1536 [Sporocytophaga myxococcoides]|uniref:Secretion system C-terminal sorting domain-containing protein n=1 Tax=Sporocytophaga myxococcoides TaxID=153721 RepID=A0A098LDZ5_9BACT|nr:T9SS type A sorting domain-containing protein [Sporocytophaga myxococcoides]GAL84308.1 hypothetical protein MYP_1536 [Sporocytophaga myxococcoides]